MKLFYLSILLTLSSYSFAQNTIRGKVKDKDNNLIEYFNAAILNVADSSYIKGGSFLNGQFEIQADGNEFLLRVSSPDYADKIILVKESNLGTIILDERQYNITEVVVTAKAPAVKIRNGGGIDFNVANTLISNVGTALDVLKRTPFVMVDNGGGISVIGRSSTLILINGRKILDQQELRSLNSSDIKSIEVIENPSAKYEAEGHSVVNIITTKRVSDFISGSIYARASQGYSFNYSVNPEFSLKLDKLALYAGYTYSKSNSSGLNYNRYERLTPGGFFGGYSYDLENNYTGNNHSYRAGVDYQLTKKSSLGVQYTGYSNNAHTDFHRNLDIQRGSEPIYTQHYYKNGERKPQNNVVSAYYGYQNNGVELNFVADYTTRKSRIFDDIEQTSDIYPEKYFSRNNSSSEYELFSAKFDGVIPFKAIKGKIETGVKYSFVDINSSVDFSTRQGEIWVSDPTLSSTTRYKEGIAAVYAIFAGTVSKINYSAGLRVEVNSVNNRNRNEQLSEIEYSKTGLFPNLSVGYTSGENFNTNLSYSRRVYRPSYNDLNSNVSYIDSISFRVGNPNLKPVYYNTLSLNNRLLKKFIVNLSASYIEQPIDMRFISFGQNGESQLTIMENSPNRWMISSTIGALLKYKIWSTQIYGGFVYAPASIVDDNVKYNFHNNSYSLSWYNQLALPKGWGAELNAIFFQPGGSYMEFGKQLSADVSISKKLFKDRLSLQLSSYNQFFKWTQYYKYSHKLFDMTYNDLNRHTVVLTMRYNFTTIRPNFRQKSAGSEERDRM